MCCRLLGVAELNKAAGEACEFCQTGTSCSIYNKRPRSCSNFNCLWLLNRQLPDSLRPDKCGAVLYQAHEQPYPDKHIDLILLEDATVPGQWRQSPLRGFVSALLKHNIAICHVCGDTNAVLNSDELD